MSYMNDPREMAIRPESGVTLEQDNRVETMYHWGAMITDLCDLPVSEYMKPMTVIVYGNGGGEDYPGTTLKTENVKIWFTVLKNSNEITNEPETVFAAGENAENIWTARWEWTGTFSNSIQVAAVVQTDQDIYNVSAILNDNEKKSYEKEIVEAKGSEAITSYKSYGVASTETPVENVTGLTYTETVTDENIKYKFEISSAETIVYLTLKLVGATSYTNMEMRYGQEIPFDKVSTEKEGYDFLYWADSNGKEYTGTTMPAQNLTLTAKYEAKKADAPIYFGTFKVATSEYDSANTTQYFDEKKLGTKYYDSVTVSECVGNGAKIKVPRISDEYYVSLNAVQRGQYKKATRYPYSFVLPNGLTENYIINLIDDANLDHWDECVTDGQIVMYNGNEYKFYVYYTDVAYPVLTDDIMPFTLKLIKK